MIRVAVEGSSVAPGGGLSFLRGAVGALADRSGMEIDVFVRSPVTDEIFGPGVRTHAVGPFRGLAHRMAWVQTVFPRLARRHDVVFAPGNLAPLLTASRTVLFLQNPHVVPQTAWRAQQHTIKHRLMRLMARLSIQRSARVLFVSKTLKEWARPYWRANPLEPDVAYPGVPLVFDSPPSRREGEDVLVVGNLVPHKCIDRAVRGFALLARRRPGIGRLRIAGQEFVPGLMAGLRDVAARHDVADRIEFLGFLRREELVRAYVASACYLSTSALESLAFPCLEAMAAGRPVVVPDAAIFREVCGPAGTYFGEGDDAIAARLAEALASPASESELQRVARERAATFSWPGFTERVGSAFAAVAGA